MSMWVGLVCPWSIDIFPWLLSYCVSLASANCNKLISKFITIAFSHFGSAKSAKSLHYFSFRWLCASLCRGPFHLNWAWGWNLIFKTLEVTGEKDFSYIKRREEMSKTEYWSHRADLLVVDVRAYEASMARWLSPCWQYQSMRVTQLVFSRHHFLPHWLSGHYAMPVL